MAEKLKYLTTEEAARVLDIHPVTLRRYCKEGRIGFYLIGRTRRFTMEELKTFMGKQFKDAQYQNETKETENSGKTEQDPFVPAGNDEAPAAE